MLHLFAALAQKERALISTRTKAALAQKKAQGVKLGNPRAAEASKLGVDASRAAADSFAERAMAHVRRIQERGITTNAGIAAALNEDNIPSPRGGIWYPTSVRNLLKRVGEA